MSPADQHTRLTAAQWPRYSEKHEPGIGAGNLNSLTRLVDVPVAMRRYAGHATMAMANQIPARLS